MVASELPHLHLDHSPDRHLGEPAAHRAAEAESVDERRVVTTSDAVTYLRRRAGRFFARRVGLFPARARTVNTGHIAVRTTFAATLPISIREKAPRPCVPMTMRSILSFPAVSLINLAVEPFPAMPRTLRPRAFSRATRL